MAEGTIKRLTDKGFGFIDTGGSKDLFFHMSVLEGVSYDELREGQRVNYEEGHGPKGPCAEKVTSAE
ncbi:MAG: cold shock domain-containing protein [Mariniblastus sp.]|jgi:CspA family cold shock protein|nr:cold shock domain-containing protein [Mariniblastus sp.]